MARGAARDARGARRLQPTTRARRCSRRSTGACGAAVGDDVVLDAGVTVDDPQFVTLDTKVRCRRHAKVSAHVVERGELVLAPVVLERGAELGIGPASAPAAW